jgi:hypothetical protein
MHEEELSLPIPNEPEQNPAAPVEAEPEKASEEAGSEDFRLAYIEQLRKMPEVIPEMIEGDNLAAISESLKRAREAYQRIAGGVIAQQTQLPPVPAGGYQQLSFEDAGLMNLDGVGKIAYGISKKGVRG